MKISKPEHSLSSKISPASLTHKNGGQVKKPLQPGWRVGVNQPGVQLDLFWPGVGWTGFHKNGKIRQKYPKEREENTSFSGLIIARNTANKKWMLKP
jgi:hypothetical protein